jgi:hypothetical protein
MKIMKKSSSRFFNDQFLISVVVRKAISEGGLLTERFKVFDINSPIKNLLTSINHCIIVNDVHLNKLE